MATFRQKPDFKKDFYEAQAWREGRLIIGIDEVGRGCLAGPVVAAAVMLKCNKKSRHLKDSKLLDEKELAASYAWIMKNSWHGIGIIHNRIIDSVNIYKATLCAMKRAVMQLLAITPIKPSLVVVDAMPLVIDKFDTDIIHFLYGERKSSSIAAASIVAKVTRDAIMRRLDQAIPGYQYTSHKGYSTPGHKRMLSQLDRSIIHRISYIDHLSFDNQDIQEQLPFFEQVSQEADLV